MIKTTTLQKEEVLLDCADIFESNFIYQMNNAYYESYTLECIQKPVESNNQTLQCGDWGAFIVKISIVFVDKEKEHPERINT